MNKFLPIHAWRGTRADYSRAQNFIVIPAGDTLEDIQGVHYWHQHHAKLNRHDLLECVAADDSFEALLRVMKVGKDNEVGKVWVRLVSSWKDTTAVEAVKAEHDGELPDLPDGYAIARGPGGRYRVKRKTDNAVLKDSIPTALEAHQWALSHATAA